jgi:hypothetical protein
MRYFLQMLIKNVNALSQNLVMIWVENNLNMNL